MNLLHLCTLTKQLLCEGKTVFGASEIYEADCILTTVLGSDVHDRTNLKNQVVLIETSGGLVISVHTCGGNYVKG